MRRVHHITPTRAFRAHGFTLIELLVVIAILALLVGLLLPTLAGARNAARQTFCSNNLRSVANAVAVYTNQHEVFPVSYVYGMDQTSGQWRVEDQQNVHPNRANGYVHWSYILYDELGEGNLPEDSFMCPSVANGGAPRTNPGEDPQNWEAGQTNDLGAGSPAALPKDRQSRRSAYTGNSAIFSRNKFNSTALRGNRFVKTSEVDATARGAGKTILATEFYDNGNAWTSLATSETGQIKSHRPVPPFLGITAGTHIFDEPDSESYGFMYPAKDDILSTSRLGEHEIINGRSRLNAVGRHHPSDTANFAFADTHVASMKLVDTVQQRLWGERFFSVTGNNKVDMEANEF